MIAGSHEPTVLARNLIFLKLPMFNLENLADLSDKLIKLSESFEQGKGSLNDVMQLTRVLRSLDKQKPNNTRSLSAYHLDELLMYSEKCESGDLSQADIARLFEITEIVNQKQKLLTDTKTTMVV